MSDKIGGTLCEKLAYLTSPVITLHDLADSVTQPETRTTCLTHCGFRALVTASPTM